MAAKCSRCGRPLKDPYSVAVGMGPECRGGAAKRGAKFPRAKWRISGGRVVFVGLEQNDGPLVGDLSKDDEQPETA
jgi:hypothetical protein